MSLAARARVAARLCGVPLAALALLAVTAHAAPPPIDPFGEPRYSAIRLSPDGQYLAVAARTDAAPGAHNLVVFDLDKRTSALVTAYEQADITRIEWAGDLRLVFELDRDRDAPEAGGYAGLYTVSRDGSASRTLEAARSTPPETTTDNEYPGTRVAAPRPAMTLIAALPGGFALVSRYGRDYRHPDAWRINLRSGRHTTAADNPGQVIAWYADPHGVIRGGIKEEPAGRQRLIIRDDEASSWRSVLEFAPGELHVYGFDADGQYLWVASRAGRERYALFRLDTYSGEPGPAVVEDAVYDVFDAGSQRARGLVQDAAGHPLFLEYMGAGLETVFLDAAWARRQSALDAALPDNVNAIVGWNRDMTRFLVRSDSARRRGAWYLYDEPRAQLRFLLPNAHGPDPDLTASAGQPP